MRGREGAEPEMAGARGAFSPEQILGKIRQIEDEKGWKLIAANPMAVCGRDHAISAYRHTVDAFSEDRAVAKDFSAEFFRYLTGERQVSRAIEKGGLTGGEMVLVSENPVESLIEKLGLKRDDDLIECSPEKTEYLGTGNAGIKAEEMALELVAMVAVL